MDQYGSQCTQLTSLSIVTSGTGHPTKQEDVRQGPATAERAKSHAFVHDSNPEGGFTKYREPIPMGYSL